jgi:integrase
MGTEPFYWAERKGWYLWTKDIEGKRTRVLLDKTKTRAFEKWKAAIRSGDEDRMGDPRFSKIAGEWLDRQIKRRERGEVSKEWLQRVARTVERFNRANPSISCLKITPKIAVKWLGESPSAAYEHTEVSVLKSILRWAVQQQRLSRNPLEAMRLSKGGRREVTLSIAEHRKLVAATPSPRIRAILWFAWYTGTRPGELRELRWEHISDDCTYATMRNHKTAKQTGKPRVIYFRSILATILRKHRQDSGLVFLNARGGPWSKDAIVDAFSRLTKKTGIEATAYAYRHSYATRALEAGMSASDLAELLGTSIEIISRNYAHLDKSKLRLANLAERV